MTLRAWVEDGWAQDLDARIDLLLGFLPSGSSPALRRGNLFGSTPTRAPLLAVTTSAPSAPVLIGRRRRRARLGRSARRRG